MGANSTRKLFFQREKQSPGNKNLYPKSYTVLVKLNILIFPI